MVAALIRCAALLALCPAAHAHAGHGLTFAHTHGGDLLLVIVAATAVVLFFARRKP